MTDGSIVPDWVNDEADTEYRSRRRKHHLVDPVVVQSTGMRATKSIISKTRVTHPRQGAANDEFRMVARRGSSTNTESGYLIAKKVATAKKSAVKKATAPAKKAAAAKKVASPKKASAKKATPSKK